MMIKKSNRYSSQPQIVVCVFRFFSEYYKHLFRFCSKSEIAEP